MISCWNFFGFHGSSFYLDTLIGVWVSAKFMDSPRGDTKNGGIEPKDRMLGSIASNRIVRG